VFFFQNDLDLMSTGQGSVCMVQVIVCWQTQTVEIAIDELILNSIRYLLVVAVV
jgi:hypothetical protein